MKPANPGTPSCGGPVSRRSFLQAGALSVLGLGMSDFLKLRALAAEGGRPAKDTAVIFIWLPGGPAHLDTYDMKPEAPIEIRGDFRPIRTNVPGIEVCELFPRHAKIADKFTLIRSVFHEFADHGGAHKRFMTGRIPATPTEFVNDAPAVTSIVCKMLERQRRGALPPCVAGVDGGRSQIDVFSLGPAYLGSAYTPFMVAGDPSSRDFKVQNLGLTPDMSTRLDDRVHLLQGMDRLRRDLDQSGLMNAMDHFSQRAVTMLTSPEVREAFDLSREPEKVRDRYGDGKPYKFQYDGAPTVNDQFLMARRLVEAGVRCVTLSYGRWDSHGKNFDLVRDHGTKLDQGLTALIEDLEVRGMLQDTTVIAWGEFGRTPRINKDAGRDHWPQVSCAILAGGGIKTGQAIGSTNRLGEYAVSGAVSFGDIFATLYQSMGIDPDNVTINDPAGRPQHLAEGKAIRELV